MSKPQIVLEIVCRDHEAEVIHIILVNRNGQVRGVPRRDEGQTWSGYRAPPVDQAGNRLPGRLIKATPSCPRAGCKIRPNWSSPKTVAAMAALHSAGVSGTFRVPDWLIDGMVRKPASSVEILSAWRAIRAAE